MKLQFSQVSFSYGTQPVLQKLQLQVNSGEFVSLVGPSGIGKSTIFQLANGLLQPDEGTIELDGKPEQNRLGKLAYMPQKDLLLNWRTVVENAALPLEIQGLSRREAHKRVIEQLDRFGLADWADAYPEELSGGMRQRVSFLRAAITGCRVLLLDEPFSALDGITRVDMQEWLLSMWQTLGITIILITHDIDEAILLADRVLVLSEQPIRQVHEFNVALPRPRTVGNRHLPQFQQTSEQIWRVLREARQPATVRLQRGDNR
ncbi:ABC transporter ATP-binding protein [Brevibacillus fulvus]|uniref:Hydroxymethylpyrimidine transport system ATP-binding protein n=1 Tax=Brevibacillus fulvus TaxID=1125967 RepID=A0A938XW61_9BACL|nr:ABC transporter ATP-binding protein [Brevibacillus fulvus]MBM7589046.1 putative hydroxymethylpyrimidine transport system ATP-binding protein [Brevibacillus fulvus]